MQQAHSEILFKDGVNRQHYETQRNWYENCAQCSGSFSITQPPSLLECGHVCCAQCSSQNTNCPCCNKKKVVKIKQYKKIFAIDVPTQLLPDKELLYNFHIVIPTLSRSFDLLNLKATITIGQILTQFQDFKNFLSRLNNGVGVVIKTKSYFYNDIKGKPISDFLKVIVSNQNNRSNTITILNRLLGGI